MILIILLNTLNIKINMCDNSFDMYNETSIMIKKKIQVISIKIFFN